MKTSTSLGVELAVILSSVTLNSSAQNGSLDTSFQAEINAQVRSIAVQRDGKILVGGAFTSVNGVRRLNIARLNADVVPQPISLDLRMYAGVTLSGPVGNYRVEWTTNPTNQTMWNTLADIFVTNGPFLFLDTNSPASPRRFYRSVTLP